MLSKGEKLVTCYKITQPLLGGDHLLTFEGGGWERVISKNYISCRQIRKHLANENSYTRKMSFMAYNAGKKSYTILRQEQNLSLEVWEKTNSFTENQITYSPSPSSHPLNSQMVGPLGIDKEPLKKRVRFGE